MNTTGRLFRYTSFGESHGPAIGAVIDGFPPDIEIDLEFIQDELNRRRPSTPLIGSGRQEEDRLEILSGVYQNKSLGTPIAFIIRNHGNIPENYMEWEGYFRPSHADDTYFHKYKHRDPRGGGRASARETAVRVGVGAFAKLLLRQRKIEVQAYTRQIGDICLEKEYTELDLDRRYQSICRCPDQATDCKMENLLKECRQTGDSVGGSIRCIVKNLPYGLGEPLYDKLTSRLAQYMMSIPASRSFEIGEGIKACSMKGSEHNDRWLSNGKTEKNLCGGIRGGISTSEDVVFQVGFKPIPSIGQEQTLISAQGNLKKVSIQGNHDVCCIPRAVSVVEAMTAICICDFLLLRKAYLP